MNGAARRKEALAEVEGCVCRDRQSTHGDAEDNFADIAKMWSVYTGATFKAQDVAAMMILVKVARMRSQGRVRIPTDASATKRHPLPIKHP